MKYVVNDQLVLSRPPEGPLASYIEAFARSLSDQGYCRFSLRRHVLIAAGFSQWLEQEAVGLAAICADLPARYLDWSC